jgi:HIRAN domain
MKAETPRKSLFRRLLYQETPQPAPTRIPEAEPREQGSIVPETLFRLPTGALLGIAGEKHYSKAIREVARHGARRPHDLAVTSEVAEGVWRREPHRKLRWFEAELRPEPDNPYDSNAVGVHSVHGQVGHLSSENAAEYADTFDDLHGLGYAGATCPAFLDVDNQQVVLALSWPHACRPAINAERRKRAWAAWAAESDLDSAATELGFSGVSTLMRGARQYAKEEGLDLPPTAAELRRQGTIVAPR